MHQAARSCRIIASWLAKRPGHKSYPCQGHSSSDTSQTASEASPGPAPPVHLCPNASRRRYFRPQMTAISPVERGSYATFQGAGRHSVDAIETASLSHRVEERGFGNLREHLLARCPLLPYSLIRLADLSPLSYFSPTEE